MDQPFMFLAETAGGAGAETGEEFEEDGGFFGGLEEGLWCGWEWGWGGGGKVEVLEWVTEELPDFGEELPDVQ